MQFPNLEQLYGGNSIFGGLLGLEQHNMAMDQAQMGQAKSLQDLFHSYQNQPVELEGKQLSNEQTAAQIPGVRAESTMLGQKAQMQSELMPELTKAERSKLLGEVDLAEFQKFQRMVEQKAMQGDPQAAQMLRRTKSVFEEIEKQRAATDRQLAVENLKTARQIQLQNMKAKAAQALQDAKASGGSTVKTYQQLAAQYLASANSAKSEEEQLMFRELAQEAASLAYAQAQAGPAAIPRPILTPEGQIGYSGGAPAALPNLAKPTETPALSGQDKQAYDWAKSNPNDPRSKQILQRLGMQ